MQDLADARSFNDAVWEAKPKRKDPWVRWVWVGVGVLAALYLA